MNIRYLITLTVAFLFLQVIGYSQSKYLTIINDGQSSFKFTGNTGSEPIDSVEVFRKMAEFRSLAVEQGYLTAGFDTLRWKGDTLYAGFSAGPMFEWAFLGIGSVPEEFISYAGYREKLYRGEEFSPGQVGRLLKKLVQLAETRGYPFASAFLDSIKFTDSRIDAILAMHLGPYTVIDSIIIKGGFKTSRVFIENYLDIDKNMPFNQTELNKIPGRLKELPFVRIIKPYEIGMREGKADIYLYLEDRKASSFDGVLGLLPDATGEILITGDVQLNLLNSFKRGENINLRWQKLQSGTQQLDLALGYPFLFKTPIGIEGKLNLYRRDTLFSQVNSRIGLNYALGAGNSAKIFYENAQANVISRGPGVQRDFVNSKTNLFGVGLEFRDLDYRFNPTRGYQILTTASAGVKTINPDSGADPEVYNNVELETDLYNLNTELSYFVPLGKRSTVLIRLRGGMIINDNIFRNEMYRIGGLKSLRGFDEQSIFASSFGIGTLEYRFILEQNSNLFLFFDQGAYLQDTVDDSINDTPFGFGAGVNFETNAGVFSLTYALGKQFDNNIEIRSGKIHFGFISFF